MKYVELTCLFGGSMPSWPMVLVVLLLIYHSLVTVFCFYNAAIYFLLYFTVFQRERERGCVCSSSSSSSSIFYSFN
jgi:hypothetical protein